MCGTYNRVAPGRPPAWIYSATGMRYSEPGRNIVNILRRMLTLSLRKLEWTRLSDAEYSVGEQPLNHRDGVRGRCQHHALGQRADLGHQFGGQLQPGGGGARAGAPQRVQGGGRDGHVGYLVGEVL